jgi:hypothetical protein
MGYTFKFDTNNERPPTNIPEIDADQWWIHQAGYHLAPGDGGFTCASNDDLKRGAFKAGKRIDQTGCFAIDKEDLDARELHVDQKHGRSWAMHIWFEPNTLRPTVTKAGPYSSGPRSHIFIRDYEMRVDRTGDFNIVKNDLPVSKEIAHRHIIQAAEPR